MKRLALILSILLLLLTIGCDDEDDNTLPELIGVEVSCDDFMELHHISKEVKVPVEGALTLILCSSPSTGFEWESAEISDTNVLEQSHHEYVGPEEDQTPPPPGTPGQEIWTFMALETGEPYHLLIANLGKMA